MDVPRRDICGCEWDGETMRLCVYHQLVADFHAHQCNVRDRRALPPDGPDVGSDIPGGGAI